MKEKLKSLKVNFTITAILTLIIGIVLLIYPGQVASVFARLVAIALFIVGAVMVIGGLIESGLWQLIVGIIIFAVGIWAWKSPAQIASIFPIAVGLLMIVHGVQNFKMALDERKYGVTRWFSAALLGMLSILFGLLCVAYAFGVVKLVIRVVGIMMIYDGLADMLVVHRTNKAAKSVIDSTISSEKDYDDYQ